MIRLIIILVSIFLSIFFGLVAYEKIDLNNSGLEYKIRHIVMSIPGLPKTSRYVLEKTADKFSKSSLYSFIYVLDTPYISSNNQPIKYILSGYIDYSDFNNIQATGSLDFAGSFAMDYRVKDKKSYFKINNISESTYNNLRIDPNKVSSVLENWMVTDSNYQDKILTIKKASELLINNLLGDPELSNIQSSRENVNGNLTYVINFKLNTDQINSIGDSILSTKSFSQSAKNVNLKINIDQNGYNLRKITVTHHTDDQNISEALAFQTSIYDLFDTLKSLTGSPYQTQSFIPQDPLIIPIGTTQRPTILEITLSDYGKTFNTEVPNKVMSTQDFLALLVARAYVHEYWPPSGRDSDRMSDLKLTNLLIQDVVDRENSSSAQILCRGTGNMQFPCSGNSSTDGDLADGRGWLKVNLSDPPVGSTSALPIDPTNNSEYHYSYCAYNGQWEMNTKLESNEYKNEMFKDQGDNLQRFEVGTNLKLIDNIPNCSY